MVEINNKISRIIFIILGFFILDVVLKRIFLFKWTHCQFGPLQFFLYKNEKVLFGLLPFNWFFVGIALVLILYLNFIFYKYLAKKEYLYCFAVGLIIAGAWSNFFDRVFYGFVIDYINFGPWSIFNLADAMIVIGVIMIFVIFFKKR